MSERTGTSLTRRAATRLLSLLAAAAVMAVGVVWGAAKASAADNPNISFSESRLQKLTPTGELVPGSDTSQLTVEDQAAFSFGWTLNGGGGLVEGDSFSVKMPQELRAAVTTAGGLGQQPLQVDHNPKDGTPETTIGSCVVTEFELRCTFNARAQELVAGGWGDINGNVSLKLQAVKATALEELPFTFSGAPNTAQVDLPGVGGIKAKVVNPFTFSPSRFAKGMVGIGSGSRTLDYNVPLGFGSTGTSLGAFLKQVDASVVFDGVQRHTINFTDTVGSGQRFFGPENWKLNLESTRADGVRKAVLDTGAAGATNTPGLGEFEITVTMADADADGQVAKIAITGPFSADANYSLTYSACSLAAPTCEVDRKNLPELKPGFNYENTIVADGTQATATAVRSFTRAFTSDVTMSLNYGTFAVTKFVAGPGSSVVEDGAKFMVEANYTLPGPADTTYPGWKAPGTLNADQLTGKVTVEAQVANRVIFYGPSAPVTFPAGTRIVLNEQVTPATAPAGYRWDGFEFEIGGTATREFVIANREITGVRLTNRLAALPKFPFAMKKALDLPAGYNAADYATKTYNFNYECTDGQSGTMLVPGDGAAVRTTKLFASGTVCTVSEDTSEGKADIDGLNLTAPAAAKVTVKDGDLAEVTLTNTYTPKTGSFQVKKTVVGGPGVSESYDGQVGTLSLPDVASSVSAVNKEYRFTYACVLNGNPVGSGEVKAKGNGVAVPVAAQLPVGAQCTVTEDRATAEIDGYSLAPVEPKTVTIGADSAVEVSFTNTYTPKTGSFQVKKTVTGGPQSAAQKEFKFNYTCGTEQGKLTVKGDGVAVPAGKSFPVGTSCVISEDADSAQINGYVLKEPAEQTIKIADSATATLVTFTNTYTPARGGFTLTKRVAGTGADLAAGKEFEFEYACSGLDGTELSRKVKVRADEPLVVTDLSAGDCVITETDPKIANADVVVSATVNGKTVDAESIEVPVRNGKNANVEVTNTYTKHMGTFEVAKTSKNGPESAAQKEFTFNYTCGEEKGSITAKGDGKPVAAGKDFPAGTSCTISEDADKAAIAGYTLTAPAAQTVTIAKGANTQVSFVNTYERDLGGFTLVKSVAGTGADLANGKSFHFSYFCTGVDGTESKGKIELQPVAQMRVNDIPVGKCTVTEDDAAIANADLATSFSVEGATTDGTKVEFDVAKAGTVNVIATNTYTAHTSTFSVAKTVSGGPADAASKEFKFNWTCGTETGVLLVKGDGVAVAVGKDFRVGTSCTVSEDDASAQVSGFTLAKPAAQTVVLPAKGEVAAVKFENAYTKVVVPSPTPSATPSTPAPAPGKGGKLAKTGSDAIVVGSIAVALLVGGAVVMLLRRRKGR